MDINVFRGKIAEKFGTQRAFCDAIGYHQNKLSKIMNGKRTPDIDEARRFAVALQLDENEYIKIFYR